MICGSGGSKSRLAKAAGAEPSGQMRDEKLHAVVARSTFGSQNVQNTPCTDHFWKVTCRKSGRGCGAKHISKSKCTKHFSVGALLEGDMSKKWTRLWREAHFQVKMVKAPHARTTFEGSDVVLRGRRKRFCALAKVSKTSRSCSISKNDGRHGTFEEDLERRISCGRRSTRDMFIRDVRRSRPQGVDFLRGVAFWSIRSSGLLRCDRCSTLYYLVSLLRDRRSTLHRWSGKIAKLIGTRPSALHSTLHFWRKVSQNCLVFDVVNFENWRKSRRIAPFSLLWN